jgi:hypothetical protein
MEFEVEKDHGPIPQNELVVSTIRDPRDAAASYFLVHYDKPNIQTCRSFFKKQLPDLLGSFRHIIYHKNKIDLLLRYEDFYENIEFAFDKISNHFNCEISSERKKEITDSLSIEKHKSLIKKLTDWGQVDSETELHGNHIGPFNGRPGYYKELFADSCQGAIKLIEKETQHLTKQLGYE